jgi:hypothetical protein
LHPGTLAPWHLGTLALAPRHPAPCPPTGYHEPVQRYGLLLCALIASGGMLVQPPPSVQDDAFLQRLRASIALDRDLQQGFTYIEKRRDVRITTLGKFVVGPLRTFEVHPSPEPGRTYKRLIAVDGQPLSPAELAQRDEEHRRDLEKEARKQQRESEEQRARRIEREQEEARDRRRTLDDALAVYVPGVVGRDTIDGEPVVMVSLRPRPQAKVTTRQGGWMKQFEGHAWFTERDAQLVRLDMQAFDDVSIGWGIVGRVHRGTRIQVERQRVGNTWLPARQRIKATGRTLLFRPFDIDLVTEYSDYKSK